MANDLNIPTIADGQADGQWQTSNDGDAALGNALADVYLVDFSVGNVTLSSTLYRSAMVFKPSAALAAARTLILPAVKRPFIFHNSDATYTVTLKSTDGFSPETALTKAVAPGEIFVGYTNGSSPGLYGAVVSTTGGGGSVSDGDKGDVTVSSSGTVWTVDVLQGAAAGNILYYDANSPAGWQKLAAGTSGQFLKSLGSAAPVWGGTPFEMEVACSDESTALTTGTAKVTFRMPCAVTLTAVRASLVTAQATGSIFTVDINEAGTTVISTKLTIDNTELTSTTAATPPVISDASLADDALMTVDIDQIGDGTAKGLKIVLIGTRA